MCLFAHRSLQQSEQAACLDGHSLQLSLSHPHLVSNICVLNYLQLVIHLENEMSPIVIGGSQEIVGRVTDHFQW
jgi:hypothetical protein